MSRQQMLHVTVITDHTQALKNMIFKTQNKRYVYIYIYIYIYIEIVRSHILKKFIIMLCFQTNVTLCIIQ